MASLDPADRPFAEKIRDLFASKTDKVLDKIFATRKERNAVEAFYQARNFAPIWLDKGVEIARAKTVAARIKGGSAKRIAEAGSIKLAVFEDQDFAGDFTKFRASLNDALNSTWMPLIQTLARNEEQTYIFLRSAGDKFNVLVITIEQREATVVQVTLSQKNLALLLRDPEGTGKAITEEATINDQE